MSFSLISPTSPLLLKLKKPVKMNPFLPKRVRLGKDVCAKTFCFGPTEEPILKEALKCVNRKLPSANIQGFSVLVLVEARGQEPVAFIGGMFAGLMRLDLNEDPLKDWVSRTVEASGLTVDNIDSDGSKSNPEEELPQQIEIE